MISEKALMQRLIRRAASQKGKTSPNPVVAAAVYTSTEVISIGVHQRAGEAHAEVLALQQAGARARGASMMVTLEPCTHYGSTPPCTTAIIDAGIARVVYAVDDPNPRVRAQSAKTVLNKAGISVESGLCEQQARALNPDFFYYIQHNKPYFQLKVGLSLDGKVTYPDRQPGQITGPRHQRQVHRLRREVDAIITGSGTILADNSQFTVRFGLCSAGFSHPAVIICDRRGRLTPDFQIFSQDMNRQVIVVTSKAGRDHLAAHSWPSWVSIVCQETSWPDLEILCNEQGFRSVLIEAGPEMMSSAIRAGIVQHHHIHMSLKVMGSDTALTWADGLDVQDLDPDQVTIIIH